LLATSSLAALLIGSGTPHALACTLVPTGGVDNTGTVSGYCVDNERVVGKIQNSGAIIASGISFTNGTLSGQIINTGTLIGGITLDQTSQISFGRTTGIRISGPTFTGGIANAGTIMGGGNGIVVGLTRFTLGAFTISTFSGGISNSGFIQLDRGAGAVIIGALSGASTLTISTFSGGITNSGEILAEPADGIALGRVSNSAAVTIANFSGGISNSGTINANDAAIAVGDRVENGALTISAFSGGISNSGTLYAALFAIAVGGGDFGNGTTTISSFGGGISNSGTISAGYNGLIVAGNGIGVGGIRTGGSVTISTFAGGIANSGTIAASAKGIFVGGTAQSGGSITIAAFGGGINNSGLILVGGAGIAVGNNGGSVTISTFSGGITNSGTIAGSAGIVVEAVSTFSGNISNVGTISGNTGIRIGAGASFAAGSAIVNTGTITGTTSAIDASTATSPVIIDQNAGTMSGNVLLSPNADVLNINGGTIAGNIVGLGASDTVNFQTGGTYTDTNTFTGINTVNINSGTTLVLNSTGNSATTVNVGAAGGGTLAGTGNIDPLTVTIDSGGTLSPGSAASPYGTFSITGNLAFAAGSYYAINIAPNGDNSKTDVTGTAALGGHGTVVVTPQFGHYGATTYTIMTATPVTGTFAGLVFAAPYGYSGSATLVYGPTYVDLDLTPGYVDFAAPPGAGQNQQNVVAAIDNYITGGGALPPGFANLANLSGPAFLNALTQLDGEAATGAATSTFQLVNDFFDLLSDIALGTGGGGGPNGSSATGFAEPDEALPADVALAYHALLKKPPLAPQQNFEQRWTAWGSAYGGTASYDGNAVAGSNNLTASDYGYAGGMDYHAAPDLKLGFALAGGGTNWSLAQNLGGGRSDVFQVAGYGIKHYGPLYFTAMAAFGNSWFTTNRTALGDQLRANFDGQDYAVRGEAGYRYAVAPMIGLTPYAAIQTQWLHTPGYSETDLSGGGFGLTYAAQSANDTRSELGARADDLTTFDNMPLILRARLAWAHDWISGAALAPTFAALPGASFTVNGAAVPQNSALVSAGGQLFLTTNWSFEAKFDGEFASSAQTYAGTGTLRYKW
jgi:uncharacterized protein with beta-barrel porin domain